MSEFVTMEEKHIRERIATITAHRACCGSEHNPQEGKFHGYCVVCGVPYPCEYAGTKPELPDTPPEQKKDPILLWWNHYHEEAKAYLLEGTLQVPSTNACIAYLKKTYPELFQEEKK